MIRVDVKDLHKLEAGLRQYDSILPKSVASSAFRNATRPMVKAAKAAAPVGKRKSANGWGKKKGPEIARGGITKRHVRIQMIPSKINAGEVSRALIGVSMRKGKVGWRTHFITTGFTDRGGRKHPGRNFLETAFNSSIAQVAGSYAREMGAAFQKWAKRNLPQGRF